MPAPPRTLVAIERALRKRHGAPTLPPTRDPFELVLWEQVAYLVDDERRREAFRLLERRVGLAPEALLAAGPKTLLEVATAGGAIGAAERAARMVQSARRVRDEWNGDLSRVLDRPPPEALRALAKFPMIGKPGAEKILLLTRTHAVLALDSNGLRVLLRLGYGTEDARYEKSYASVRAATAPEEKSDVDWMCSLHALLRRHGQATCRRSRPDCPECPLAAACPSRLGGDEP